jgi:hypothetical protein
MIALEPPKKSVPPFAIVKVRFLEGMGATFAFALTVDVLVDRRARTAAWLAGEETVVMLFFTLSSGEKGGGDTRDVTVSPRRELCHVLTRLHVSNTRCVVFLR